MATAATKLAPPVIGGLICSAVIAATMSSADSDMLCASTITLNTFAFMLRSAGPFAAFALGLAWKEASRSFGIVSIILGSAAGIYWQVIGQPYGIMAIVFGSAVSVIAFAATTWVEKAMGGKIALPIDGVHG